jgi:deazaflavin-dependent oxidoreductase (nitroreductase family)
MNEQKEQNTFPRPGTLFHSMIFRVDSRQKYFKVFRKANRVIVPLYRLRILPLIGMGGRFVLLQARGRKSGKTRYTPVEYFRVNGVIHIFSGWGEHANWVRNLRAHPEDFYAQVGFRKFHARAEFIEDADEKLALCCWLVTEKPFFAKTAFGWKPGEDDPETADFSPLIENLSFIRIYPR